MASRLGLFCLVVLSGLPYSLSILPSSSWETLPVFFHACNFSGAFSAEAARFIATSGFASATLEKGQGVFSATNATTTAEERILAAAAQLKALNASLPIVAYFNSVLNWPYYALARDMEQHPPWALANTSGAPVLLHGDSSFPQPAAGMSVFDFSQAAVRDWYASACASLDASLIDGCFQDRANEESFPGVAPGAALAYAAGHDAVLGAMQRALGPERFVIDNNYLNDTGALAVMLEDFDASEASIELLQRAASRGFIVQAHAGNAADGSDAHCKGITNSLAAFLIGASERSFYACSSDWAVPAAWPAVPSDWMTWHDEYSKPLGRPLGAAVKRGALWTRSFSRGTNVSFDCASNSGTISWAAAS